MRLTSNEFIRITRALADPQRLVILEKAAAAGELSCGAIAQRCPVSQATISHHLKELAMAGLLERRKEGQYGYYRFLPEVMEAYVEELGRRMCLKEPPKHGPLPEESVVTHQAALGIALK